MIVTFIPGKDTEVSRITKRNAHTLMSNHIKKMISHKEASGQ